MALKRQGYTVLTAADGEEALRTARSVAAGPHPARPDHAEAQGVRRPASAEEGRADGAHPGHHPEQSRTGSRRAAGDGRRRGRRISSRRTSRSRRSCSASKKPSPRAASDGGASIHARDRRRAEGADRHSGSASSTRPSSRRYGSWRRACGFPLERALAERGRHPDELPPEELAQDWDVGFIDLQVGDVQPDALRTLPEEYARGRLVVPIEKKDRDAPAGHAQPARQAERSREIEQMTGLKVVPFLAPEMSIRRAHLLYRAGDILELLRALRRRRPAGPARHGRARRRPVGPRDRRCSRASWSIRSWRGRRTSTSSPTSSRRWCAAGSTACCRRS